MGWLSYGSYDKHLDGGGDENDGKITNPDAVILAKRAGAHPGAMFQFVIQLGMSLMSLVVNEMGRKHMQRVILFFNTSAWAVLVVGIPLWLTPLGYSPAAASIEVIVYGVLVGLMMVLLFIDCCLQKDDSSRCKICKWVIRFWSSMVAVYCFYVIFKGTASWDERFPLSGDDGYAEPTLVPEPGAGAPRDTEEDEGVSPALVQAARRLSGAQDGAEYAATVQGAHAGMLMQMSFQLCFVLMAGVLNEMGEAKPQRVILTFLSITFFTLLVGMVLWLPGAGFDPAVATMEFTLNGCIYGLMFVALFVDCCTNRSSSSSSSGGYQKAPKDDNV